MRNGPLVHRRAQVSRFYGSPTPLDRLAALAPLTGLTTSSRRTLYRSSAATDSDSHRIHLGTRLPINLRMFLAEQLGRSARVEEDAIVALGSHSTESVMREMARAIRRFSAERAREVWSECAIGLERLAHEFFSISDDRAPVVLCLRCAAVGSGPLDQHCGPNCLAVDLSSAVRAERVTVKDAMPNADTMHCAVENFRGARTRLGLAHYDLDCYVAGGQVIFTWRPLPTLN